MLNDGTPLACLVGLLGADVGMEERSTMDFLSEMALGSFKNDLRLVREGAGTP